MKRNGDRRSDTYTLKRKEFRCYERKCQEKISVHGVGDVESSISTLIRAILMTLLPIIWICRVFR